MSEKISVVGILDFFEPVLANGAGKIIDGLVATGGVLLEASAAGVPIVATDVGGTPEIVLDGVTGHLVPPKDPIALTEAVIKSLTDKTESQHFREAARERATHEFSINVAAQKLSAFWNAVLDETQETTGI